MLKDARYAARLLFSNPGFTLAAALTLALGIGANTAVFTLADATLLRPFKGLVHPEELVTFAWSTSYPDYAEYAKRTDLFAGVLATTGSQRVTVTGDGAAELAPATFVSGNAFDVLGVSALRGRTLVPSDEVRNGPIVVVLANDYWATRFGSRPDVIGRTVRVNGRSATIVGVAPPGFRGTSLASRPSLYLPITAAPQIRTGTGFFSRVDMLGERGFVWLTAIGRLRPGVSSQQAATAIGALYSQLHPPRAGARNERMEFTPLAARALGGTNAVSVRQFIWLLVGAVGLTLLIGCANLATLLLAKAAARRREVGVRLALGASRARVTRQMLLESLMLSALGGAAGLAVAYFGLRVLGRFQLPGGMDIETLGLEMDETAFAATAVVSIGSGLLFGVVPAWRAAGDDVLGALRNDARMGAARSGLRSSLIAAQVALSLVLLAGTGLFLRSLKHALDVPVGFDARGVATASVNLGLARFDEVRAKTFYDAALERVKQLPDVSAAAWTWLIPTNGLAMGEIEIEGHQRRPGDEVNVSWSYAGPDYFNAAGTRVLNGRDFAALDRAGAPRVAIVNQALVDGYFAGGDPLGRRLKFFDEWIAIVGVVENTTVRQLRERPVPYVYLAFNQWLTGKNAISTDAAHLFVRTSGDATTLLPVIRDQLRSIDPEVAVYDVQPFAYHVRELLMPQRMGVILFMVCSQLAVSLAAIGIYGVASYVTRSRTREIGIRIALGARHSDIDRLILRQGLGPIVAGIAAGVLLALWGGRLARSFLYDISPSDPLTFTSAGVLLISVAMAAIYLPARRASRVEPAAALRHE